MSAHRDPDRLIAAYFAQPAPDLPDRAFDAVRSDIHRTRQRLVLGPWQEPDPRVLARALPVAATILLVASLGILNVLGLGPGGGPTASPGPTPNVFRSPLYHYSIVVPTGWTATPATVRWDGESQPSLGPNVDQLAGPHLIVLGYAGPFAGNLAAFVQDRIAANARDHSDTCPSNALQLNQPTTIGGEAGVLLGLNCGARIDQAITVHDGVGYALTIRDTAFSSTLDPADFASVQSMLDSLIFPGAPIQSP
ncbi:MAG: hypothetical protein ACXWN2_09405 [Candidatus Limnocylindrales bacterium]